MRRIFAVILLLLAAGCSRPAAPTPRPAAPAPAPAPVTSPAAPPPASPAPPPQVWPSPALAAPAVREPLRPLGPGEPLKGGYFLLDMTNRQLWGFGGALAPVWSPDGRFIALTACCSLEGGLDVVDMQSGHVRRISGHGDPISVAWSPDGRRLAFTRMVGRSSSGHTQGLFLINPDGTSLQELSAEERIDRIAWSPDGRRITYTVRGDRLPILRQADLYSGQVRTLGPALGSVWSPDGSQLIVVDDQGYRLLDRDGNLISARALAGVSSPYWTTRGVQFLRVETTDQYATDQLIFVNEGGDEVALDLYWRYAAWAPDRSRLAYISAGCKTGEFDIYVVAPDGTQKRRLTSDKVVKSALRWTPDGRSIIFSEIDKLLQVDLSTGQVSTLVDAGELMGAPVVRGSSPDGRYLTFAGNPGRGVCD